MTSPTVPAGGAPPRDPHHAFIHDLIGQRLGGRYEVTHVLGMGGMGVVVGATNTDLDQRVAIKLMFPEHAASEVLAARFTREAKLAAKVQSPHLVRVFDVGKHESGVPYLVMELLSGRDLGAELLKRGGPLPVGEAVDYVMQAALGLAEVHQLGFIHRDLKPSNLFLAHAAGTTMVKILDFGITKEASALSGSLTSTETILGTPSYMSPEQIRSTKDADVRSDVWSLGVILYELLTGQGPFPLEGDSMGALFAAVLCVDPVPMRSVRPELPAGLDAIVLRCLAKEPAERFQTVLAFAEALATFAPPAARGHVEAVRRLTGSDPALPVAAAVTQSDPAVAIGNLPTDRPPSVALDRTAFAPDVAKSLVASTRSIPEVPRPRRPVLPFIVAGTALLVGAISVSILLVRASSTTDASPAAAAAPPGPSTVASTGPAADAPPPIAPLPEPSASVPDAPPALSASSKGASPIASPPPARRGREPSIARTMPPPAASSASTPSTLVFDRK